MQLALYAVDILLAGAVAVEDSVGVMDEIDEIVGESMTAQTDDIDSCIADRLLTGDNVWGNVHGETAAALYHHVAANAAELMAQNLG